MKTLNINMIKMLRARGFVGDHGAWRLDRHTLPVIIYQERGANPDHRAIGWAYGGPGRPLSAKVYDPLVNISQRRSRNPELYFYDFSQDEERALAASEFEGITLRLVDSILQPPALIEAVLREDVRSAAYFDEIGPIKAALQVAAAYSLTGYETAMAQKFYELPHASSNYADLLSLASEDPERIPGIRKLVEQLLIPAETPGVSKARRLPKPRWKF